MELRCFPSTFNVYNLFFSNACPSQEDLAAKQGLTLKTPEPKESQQKPAAENQDLLDPLSSHSDLQLLVADAFVENKDVGHVKIQLKPQKGRSPIVVLMFKGVDDSKFSQKLQVVVKSPLLVADAMAIVKYIGAEFLDQNLSHEEAKSVKTEMVAAAEKGELLEWFKANLDLENKNTKVFVGLYERRVQLGNLQAALAQPSPAPGDVFLDMGWTGESGLTRNPERRKCSFPYVCTCFYLRF